MLRSSAVCIVINGDSNMAEPTVLLKIASTDLVAAHAGGPLPGHEPGYCVRPGGPLRAISHDLTGTATFETTDGKHYTALSVQRHYLDAARQFVQQYGAHHRHVEYALDLWQHLDAIESGDYSSIDTEIDWAIKKKLLDAYIARARGWSARRLCERPIRQLDLAYHDIDPDRSVFRSGSSRAVKRILPEGLRRRRRLTPATRPAALALH